MDWKIRRGEMRALTGFRFPRGLGHDFAGVVDAVGPGVNQWPFETNASFTGKS
jgi:NADPH:quinone reductase-like Zn-dependent oxidoreductase